MKPHLFPVCLSFLLLCSLAHAQTPGSPAAPPAAAGVVTKTVEPFRQDTDWTVNSGSTGLGKIAYAADGSLELTASYSGQGFENVQISPPQPLYIPGNLKSISVRVRAGDARPGAKLVLIDGYGRGEVAGKYFQPDLPLKAAQANEAGWQTIKVTIPDDWARPVAITGILFHNYATQHTKSEARIGLADLAVDTDLAAADPVTGRTLAWKPDPRIKPGGEQVPATPLLAASLTSTAPGHLFAGESPELRFTVRNWLPTPAALTLDMQITDEAGKAILQESKPLAVETLGRAVWKPACARFGPYRARLSWQAAGREKPAAQELRFATVPAPRVLTEEQKLRSPYGLNYHGGAGVFLPPFVKAGLVWYREYAFSWDFLKRARGEDNRYAGWPFYPAIVKAYRDAGVIMSPVMQRSIPRPALKGGKVTGDAPPDREWISQMSSVILAFPEVRTWELDNEYELPTDVRQAEVALDWAHYATYHRKFGELVRVLGNGELTAIENGQAGIRPELDRAMIARGAFDDIGVINSHHYTGTEPPETNFGNFNTGMASSGGGDHMEGLFPDALHAMAQAAKSGARPRQAWLTEFGWDTLAGKVVTEAQQAAYLARGYMLAAAAGIDKSFWFYNFDAEKPTTFFDGCGLMTFRHEPKPSMCAVAGLTSLLPQLHVVGGINAGPGTLGFVFEQDGKLVAALWRILPGEGSRATFDPGAKLYDQYANPLKGSDAALGIAPVYAVGISRESQWYRQTAYQLETPGLVASVAGEENPLEVTVKNNRPQPIKCELTLALPPGWNGPAAPVSATVAPGESAHLSLPFTVAAKESFGMREGSVQIKEDGALVKAVPVQVQVQAPYTLAAGSIHGEPGTAEVPVTVTNHSRQPRAATLTMALPSTWKAAGEPLRMDNLAPGETRTGKLKFAWSNTVPAGEKAEVVLAAANGFSAAQPLIPPVARLARVPGAGWFGGKAADWPAANQLPSWMLGSTTGAARAKVWLGWTAEGLWGACEVEDSKVLASDPRSFWAQDALEIFVDAGDRKGEREFARGDHQFWLVPLAQENRAYVGRWARADLKETLYDIPHLRTAAARTATGYTMEFLIPWSQFDGIKPGPGTKLGFNLNLSVRGTAGDREVYWPEPKDHHVTTNPGGWGRVECAP